jgi:hypothetical protein
MAEGSAAGSKVETIASKARLETEILRMGTPFDLGRNPVDRGRAALVPNRESYALQGSRRFSL